LAFKNTTTPTALILSRQNIKDIPTTGTSRYQDATAANKGGYLVKSVANPDITLFANGSEVSTLIDAAVILEKENNLKINVASIISEGLFKQQSKEYQESVIPKGKLVFGLTAGLPVNLEGLIGDSGKVVGLDHFGYSAPASVLDQKFGFTSENVSKEILKYIEESK
jgi:transketolase